MADTRTRAEFDAHLDELHLRGQWSIEEQQRTPPSDGPRPMGVPYLWPWATIRTALAEACDVLTDSLTQRRSILFVNPALPNRGTAQTFGVGVQLVTPGETAWAHRHTMAAIRFGIEGDRRLATIVDGERLAMEPGDLILTPGMSWHDHRNDSDRDGMWLDAIDSPLTAAVGQRWYQAYGETVQPVRETGAASAYRYPWTETRALLDRNDGVRFPYPGSASEGLTMSTLGCFIVRLQPGRETAERRHTAAATYFVVKGSGTTVVDGQELAWGERDVFVVPNWMRYRHRNASTVGEAILFEVNDEPLLRAIGLYRSDPETAPQLVPA
jgi:1-hydroxy-2-naphthoate dioxygenase